MRTGRVLSVEFVNNGKSHEAVWFQEPGSKGGYYAPDGQSKRRSFLAAPLEFTDHVGAPLQEGLLLVHNTLVGVNLRDRIKIGCAGKVVSAFDIARTMAMGADWCNSARGFMFALGCIQAQTCHTGRCPTGVTTQDPLRQQALVVPDKATRVFNFHQNTLKALQELVQAAGLQHPNQIGAHHLVRRVNANEVRLLSNLLPTVAPGALDAVAADPQARAVVIAANGRAFCAGHDLKEMKARPELAYYQALFATCSKLMMSIRKLEVPVIARVQGLATAAGCQMVAQCDLAVAVQAATFGVNGIDVGLFCATPSVPLVRNMAPKQAMEMLLTGEFIDAQRAYPEAFVDALTQAGWLAAAARVRSEWLANSKCSSSSS